MTQRPKIVVVGSINMDLVATGPRLPSPGETVLAERFAEIPGGKGANQAVAASRAGGDVAMIGRVGDDAFGVQLVQNLTDESVDCQAVVRTSATPSGVALIAVDASGENQIVVVPGANGLLTPDDVRRHESLIEQADALLLQLEVPVETVVCAIDVARKSKTRILLDPSPTPTKELPEAMFAVDLICPNQSEAMALIGQHAGQQTGQRIGQQTSADPEMATVARILRQRGAQAVAVTLGARGVALFHANSEVEVQAFDVEAVDTTAAGDAFAGATAVRWAETDDLLEAIRWGNAAGALAGSRAGAQPSLATRAEIEALIRRTAR